MILLVFILCLIIFTISAYFLPEYWNTQKNEILETILLILNVGAGILIIITLGLMVGFLEVFPRTNRLKQELKMYQEENYIIEGKIERAISAAMDHEDEVYNFKDIETALIVYPELKSNELINNLITVYQENSIVIKDIKEKILENEMDKWRLYFGGNFKEVKNNM